MEDLLTKGTFTRETWTQLIHVFYMIPNFSYIYSHLIITSPKRRRSFRLPIHYEVQVTQDFDFSEEVCVETERDRSRVIRIKKTVEHKCEFHHFCTVSCGWPQRSSSGRSSTSVHHAQNREYAEKNDYEWTTIERPYKELFKLKNGA